LKNNKYDGWMMAKTYLMLSHHHIFISSSIFQEKWDGKREYFKNKYNKNDNQPTPSLINNANSNAYRPPEYTINSSDLKEQSPTPPPNKPYNPFEDV